MAQIDQVKEILAFRFPSPSGDMTSVTVTGSVSTSGWSAIRLSPRFYANPPADGIWDLDLTGDPPFGMALQVVLPVTASTILGAPAWLKGFRVHGNPSVESKNIQSESLQKMKDSEFFDLQRTATQKTSIFRQSIASYDDSFNPIGFCSGFGSIKMKKLRHELTLIVEGPDDSKIRKCIEQAAGAGLIAAIIAVYATGGGGLAAAVTTFLSQVEACLGNEFTVKLDDSSHWIEWCT